MVFRLVLTKENPFKMTGFSASAYKLFEVTTMDNLSPASIASIQAKLKLFCPECTLPSLMFMIVLSSFFTEMVVAALVVPVTPEIEK